MTVESKKPIPFTESQGILADYNLMMDKLNTDTERAEIEAEAEEVKAANASEAAEIENLFAEKQQREKVCTRVFGTIKKISQPQSFPDDSPTGIGDRAREEHGRQFGGSDAARAQGAVSRAQENELAVPGRLNLINSHGPEI